MGGPNAQTYGVGPNSPTALPFSGGPMSPNAPTAMGGWGAAAAPAMGAQVDFGPRYRVEKLLGQGGMGAVYLARDLELDRPVALKLVRPDLMVHPEAIARFKQELLLASKISHRNILRIHDLGDAGGTKFISMAYVDGEDLHHLLLREGKLPVDRMLHIAKQLCGALEAAHHEGVVHRDLKPQNIMLGKGDHVQVSDFGLAKSLGAVSSMTQSGEMLGTPRYMAPEQVEAKSVDARTDIYALGLIFYEMVTGDVPFTAETTLQLMYKRAHEAPPPPNTVVPDLPLWLNNVIMKCLERDAASRYQSTTEILADIEAQRAPDLSPQPSVHQVFPQVAATRPASAKTWMAISAAILVLAIVIGIFAFLKMRSSTPPKSQKVVSVLVADFNNLTGDPILNGTLEPMFNVALEGASFINAYSRGEARKLAQKLPNPTDKLDEQSARLVALSQGLTAVITGQISRRGDTYTISAVALDAGTSGNVIAEAEVTAQNKDDIVKVLPKLVAPLRKALGDTTPESVQFESSSGAFTAASLETVHQDSIGLEKQFAGHFDEALAAFSKAIELDPKFARAYSGMAAMAINLGKIQDAENYIRQAMQNEDRMTERERYRTRGLYYAASGKYEKCVEEYSQLVTRYPADRVGQLNLASCSAQLRQVSTAVQAARKAVEIVPKGALQRFNLAFLSAFAGDFPTAEKEARIGLETNPTSENGHLNLAEAQLGQGQLAEATETYGKLDKLSDFGKSMAVSGLADLALYEGRFSDAVKLLEEGAAADITAKRPEKAGEKYAALAHVQQLRGQPAAAASAAEKALANSKAVNIKFLAALAFVEAGQHAKAQKLSAELAAEIQPEAQSYAKIIDGASLVKRGNAKAAIKDLTEAVTLLDTWIARFELGQAYLEAGLFVEADSEFDRCVKRRGESMELFLDNIPTFGYYPAVYYFQGKVRQGLKSAGYADAYRAYLNIRGNSSEDPRVAEVRRLLPQ